MIARLLCVLTLLTAGLLVPTPAFAGSFVGRYQLSFADSAQCLEVTSGAGGKDDGTRLRQWGCNGNSNQLWRAYLVPCGDRGCQILVNAYSGKCAARGFGGLGNGTPIVQWPCDDDNGSEWWLLSYLGGPYHLWADLDSPHCLQHHNPYTGNGDPADLWGCNNSYPNQAIYFDVR
ncbi:MAG TPA: RICIN domain-containing protein [Mycobacteriales bacterium]|nr:RICIN domain-containing protein [Mycobacteriales bacterium]